MSQTFITGQAARVVIGQVTFTSQNFGTANTVFGSAQGLAIANGTIFLADANRLGMLPINNRVLMFPTTMIPDPTAPLANLTRCPVCLGQATNVLGQPNFSSSNPARTQSGMNLPLGVASDGVHVAIADTANNRVLLWNSFPNTMDQPADLVLGQPDFTTLQTVVVNASSLRAPQGVWFQNGKFFVADTQNNRVLIWNSIPTKNNQAADVVLGAPNFTTLPVIDQTSSQLQTNANSLLTPTSVSSDGTRLIVADLGFSRVLIWNHIPTQNNVAADLEIGQRDMFTSIPNDTTDLCASNGTDSNGNPTFPSVCGNTMNFPRFAISDGTRLYVADTGNDRVLVYNSIPTTNAAPADVILGQPDQFSDVVTSNSTILTPVLTTSASNVTTSPTSLAWDGTNLYVADPTNFRVLVFTPATPNVPLNGVVNSGSLEISAIGTVTLSGTITAGNTVTVTINGTNYAYTIVSTDTFDTINQTLANQINTSNGGAGDPNVIAEALVGFGALQLVAKVPGTAGDNITLAATVSNNATIAATASDANLSNGGDASTLAPGTIVAIQGTNLADGQASAPANAQQLPFTLGGVQVYVDGIISPLLFVSQTQINVQIPWETTDTNSSNLFVRTQHADGSVTVVNAIGLPITQANPGIFGQGGAYPQKAFAFHGSSNANAIVSVDGSIAAGDIATVGIQDRTYNYTVQATDSLATVRDALIGLINANPQEVVTASPNAAFTRIFLQAKVAGPAGDGIPITATSTSASGGAGSVTMTAVAANLCCANIAGAPVNSDNPLVAGETFFVYATGLGLVDPTEAKNALVTGAPYFGPVLNNPVAALSSLCGGSSATIVSGGAEVGAIGIYKVILQLNGSLTTNPDTQCTIAQNVYTSNIVLVPVIAANPASLVPGN